MTAALARGSRAVQTDGWTPTDFAIATGAGEGELVKLLQHSGEADCAQTIVDELAAWAGRADEAITRLERDLTQAREMRAMLGASLENPRTAGKRPHVTTDELERPPSGSA